MPWFRVGIEKKSIDYFDVEADDKEQATLEAYYGPSGKLMPDECTEEMQVVVSVKKIRYTKELEKRKNGRNNSKS